MKHRANSRTCVFWEWVFSFALMLALGTVVADAANDSVSVEPLPASWEPSQHPPGTSQLLENGRRTYEKQCAPCHGPTGRGDGPAAYLLFPRPRDFTAARYRLVSTWEGVPTDDDLFRTISRGIPGSAMPSWSHLSEEERWGLVYYVKTFAKTPIKVAPTKEPDKEGNGGTGEIEVPPEPPYTAQAREHARSMYKDACASCHGAEGRGDGNQAMHNEEGLPIQPRDLTAGIFKGSPEPKQLYQRLIAGMPGTPMASASWGSGNDAWDLVHYLLDLSNAKQRARAEMRRFAIPVTRVAALPDHPDAGVWNRTPLANIHLMPLWWRYDRPEQLTVRALHDGQEIALLLVWTDVTHDATAMRPQDFRDAAAVELSPASDPPFFAMGQRGQPVNIWMWKAERQADLEPAFQDLEKIYPNLGIDSYPNLLKSPLEQPHRHALTLQSDPTFVTAWGAGNIVADPTRGSASEDLTAQGFGTLRARSPADQSVTAKGEYVADSYRVMFRRKLESGGPGAVALKPGDTVPVAFAVWDGAAGDRDGKKSVTIWQELRLDK
jgi:mono/diheme cytochrome c family protein